MIFIPTLKPQAQGGVRFSDFHAPPFADFHTFLSVMDFGAPLARLARLSSFSNFKLACPLCPPRLHRASTAPAPRPRPSPAAPEFDCLKSLYYASNYVRIWWLPYLRIYCHARKLEGLVRGCRSARKMLSIVMLS